MNLPNAFGPRARVAVTLAFFIYVVAVRTHGVASTFLLLGEQTRDWTLALGSWRDLPLTGTPSTSGGRGFGPVYYWVLWIGRHIVGPFSQNLPHAGGLTVSLLQAAGDLCLFVALTRRVSYPLALAAALLVATGPFDVGLSAAIWNPPVATALVKMTMALVLMTGAPLRSPGLGARASAGRARVGSPGSLGASVGPVSPSLWRVAGITVVAWLAVQAHSSSFFVTAPVLAALAAQPALFGGWRRTVEAAALAVGVIVVLQIPYIVAQIQAPEGRIGPTVVIESLADAATVQPAAAFARITNITGWLVMHTPDSWSYALATFVATLVAAWRARRDLLLLSASVAPLVMATVLFATWTRPYDSYWFMTLAPAMVVTFALAVDHGLRLAAHDLGPVHDFEPIETTKDTKGTGKVTKPYHGFLRALRDFLRGLRGFLSGHSRLHLAMSMLLLAAVLLLQPARIAASKTFFRYPQYRALLEGSRAVMRRTPVVRDLRVDFQVHETTDVQYVYRLLGGRVAPDGEFIAAIHADGTVTFSRR